MRIPGHRPRRAATQSSAARLVALRSLLEIATCAVALQPAAEEVIRSCARDDAAPVQVARQAGRVAADYFRLHGWAVDLTRGTDQTSLQCRVTELVHYHAAMVDLGVKLAFPKFPSTKLEQRRRSLTGLGESARTLREAQSALALWIADIERADDSR